MSGINLSDLLEAREGEKMVIADILRILAVYGRLWEDEVYFEVVALNKTMRDEPPTKEQVKRGLEKLITLNAIGVTEGLRTSSARPVPVRSQLISLVLPEDSVKLLLEDERLKMYRQKLLESLRRLRR